MYAYWRKLQNKHFVRSYVNINLACSNKTKHMHTYYSVVNYTPPPSILPLPRQNTLILSFLAFKCKWMEHEKKPRMSQINNNNNSSTATMTQNSINKKKQRASITCKRHLCFVHGKYKSRASRQNNSSRENENWRNLRRSAQKHILIYFFLLCFMSTKTAHFFSIWSSTFYSPKVVQTATSWFFATFCFLILHTVTVS